MGVVANYNSLNEYVNSLRYATETPCPEYQKIGVKVDGSYRQLNANILQIENEYYSTVRPKQIQSFLIQVIRLSVLLHSRWCHETAPAR